MILIDYVRKLNTLNWDLVDETAVRKNLTQLGFTLTQDSDQEEIWKDPNGQAIHVLLDDEHRPPHISLVLRSEEVENLDETEFAQLEEQMEADYEQAVSDLTQILGQPNEVGTVSGSQNMSAQFADLGACWLRDTHQLMLLYGQQDTELPLQLVWLVSAKAAV